MSENNPSHLSGHELEIRDGKTIGAMAIIEEKFIPDLHAGDPYYKIPKKLQEKLYDIKIVAETNDPQDPNRKENTVWIFYNTQTGEIGYPPQNHQWGEYSKLAVSLFKKGERVQLDEKIGRWETTRGVYEFQLYRSGQSPSVGEYSTVLMADAGQKSADMLQPNRWIQPERLAPGAPNHVVGVYETPGQSQFPVDTQGDFVIINALRKFNQKYSQRGKK